MRWQLPLFAVLVQRPLDGADAALRRRPAGAPRRPRPAGDVVVARFRSRPDLLVVKRAVREQDGGWWVAGRQRLRRRTTPARTGWRMSSGGCVPLLARAPVG